jgi:hypothetical protein
MYILITPSLEKFQVQEVKIIYIKERGKGVSSY